MGDTCLRRILRRDQHCGGSAVADHWFWETVLVALMCALGVFLGAVKDKSAFCKRVINKLFPPKA